MLYMMSSRNIMITRADNVQSAQTLGMGMPLPVLSRVMRKYNSVTYEVGKAKAEQAAGMFGLAAE